MKRHYSDWVQSKLRDPQQAGAYLEAMLKSLPKYKTQAHARFLTDVFHEIYDAYMDEQWDGNPMPFPGDSAK